MGWPRGQGHHQAPRGLGQAKVGLMGGDDFEPDDPCDVIELEALKAKVCFVSEDVDKDNAKMELSMSKPYTLPDGTRITLGRERYRAAELLFDPAMSLREEDSLQNTVLDSILSCDRKTWPILAQTVILTGGTTEMPGLNRRLQRELTKASRANGVRLKYTVMAPEDDHNNTVWIGGSMLASAGALDGLWFTRAEYEEYAAAAAAAAYSSSCKSARFLALELETYALSAKLRACTSSSTGVTHCWLLYCRGPLDSAIEDRRQQMLQDI
ncbi:unnamed protein product [Ectocarpus fasciculatus]